MVDELAGARAHVYPVDASHVSTGQGPFYVDRCNKSAVVVAFSSARSHYSAFPHVSRTRCCVTRTLLSQSLCAHRRRNDHVGRRVELHKRHGSSRTRAAVRGDFRQFTPSVRRMDILRHDVTIVVPSHYDVTVVTYALHYWCMGGARSKHCYRN